ncbi:MAG: methylmalonyl-CoA mutase family protein, partial [Myxococcota bacterium]
RLNAVSGGGTFVRSMATRRAHRALSNSLLDALRVLRAAQYDMIVVETAGIGQADSEIVDYVDLSLYVMTPEFGAPSQLEKIDMLDLADLVVLNKCDRQGAEDALRDTRKQWRRNHEHFDATAEVPVFGTVACRWNDPGMDQLYAGLREEWAKRGGPATPASSRRTTGVPGLADLAALPSARKRHLSDTADRVREYRRESERLADLAAQAYALALSGEALKESRETGMPAPELIETLMARRREILAALPGDLHSTLETWPETRARYERDIQEYGVRERVIRVKNHCKTLSGTSLPKVALPRGRDWGELTRFVRQENLPGYFPFTAGVFPFKRSEEEPVRMFAGEGGPERTNRRFHYLAGGQSAARLSTAFDSVTLYGRDPDPRPDIYGKVGNSGVSVSTLDDAKILYSGFDLCAENTSVSLTINGPAAVVLAFFLNAAIDQQVEKHLSECGQLDAVRERFAREFAERGASLPQYRGEIPATHNGLGLGLLGIPGRHAVNTEVYSRIRSDVLSRVRGTVQADILKEDQAQNTCIFSTDFALKLQGDIQEQFIREHVRNFYSISISGYHMAEAGANPITQLAFTLANGLTFCEYYLARGMEIDDFAPNFSFFFSNGLDAEYDVIGRVARRIWAIALRDFYGASERSQKLKYHIQTSGRSLHAQEMAFNDIRTTLQALKALQDNCNSLHTNAYDEALTTPTEESVRRALAIQLIINRELGTSRNENSLQGSYYIEELTDRVEQAVLDEFDRLSDRGGVLGAMETLYQRSKIQEESMHYESLKHSGELPVVGVNTFQADPDGPAASEPRELMRSSEAEKQDRLDAVSS